MPLFSVRVIRTTREDRYITVAGTDEDEARRAALAAAPEESDYAWDTVEVTYHAEPDQ